MRSVQAGPAACATAKMRLHVLHSSAHQLLSEAPSLLYLAPASSASLPLPLLLPAARRGTRSATPGAGKLALRISAASAARNAAAASTGRACSGEITRAGGGGGGVEDSDATQAS